TLVVAILAKAAHADEQHGLQLAVRGGFVLPLGGITQDNSYGDYFTGFVPLRAEVGYRIDRNWMLGGFFQYAFGLPKNCPQGISCAGNVLAAGLQAHYHFVVREDIDPWVGLGFGYE